MIPPEIARLRQAFFAGTEVHESDHTYYFQGRPYESLEDVWKAYRTSVERREAARRKPR